MGKDIHLIVLPELSRRNFKCRYFLEMVTYETNVWLFTFDVVEFLQIWKVEDSTGIDVPTFTY